jgi:tRNA threonylcarbamoyladenosine biosynthesis protein TsaE
MQTISFTYHLADIHTAAANVLNHLDHKILLVKGDMGAGKTTFISALIREMGSNDEASSPTFGIVNEYALPDDKIYHFDFYRINTLEEALNFGVEDYLYSENYVFIEWYERIEELLPETTQTLIITPLENNIRSLKLTINSKSLTENIAMTDQSF